MYTRNLTVTEGLGFVGRVLFESLNTDQLVIVSGRKSGETHVDSLLRISLLDNTDRRICNEDEQNDRRLYESTPPGAGVLLEES